MSKDKISDYSSTANSNTDIAGINIDEGCAPSGINDAIRTLMAQLKTWQSGGQDVYIHPAGSASAPSITATGDTNTGIFFPAADTIAFAEGGVEAARFDSAGNFGVGTSTINNAVTTYRGAGVSNYIQFTNATTGTASTDGCLIGVAADDTSLRLRVLESASMIFSTNDTERMRLDASGNLGIGTTSPNRLLSLYATQPVFQITNVACGNTQGTIQYQVSGDTAFILDNQGSGSGGPIIFQQAGTERARIDSSGNLLVGTTNATVTSGAGTRLLNSATTPQIAITVSASSNNYLLYNSTASAYRFFVSDAGQINATSTSITAISDVSLKENVRDLETGLNEVMALKPRRFDWKEETKLGLTNVAGFIAQEVEQVLPELVQDYQYNDNETKKSLKMGDILPTLVKAIQEQQAIITALTARITALEQA